jgi:hypothetical protein
MAFWKDIPFDVKWKLVANNPAGANFVSKQWDLISDFKSKRDAAEKTPSFEVFINAMHTRADTTAKVINLLKINFEELLELFWKTDAVKIDIMSTMPSVQDAVCEHLIGCENLFANTVVATQVGVVSESKKAWGDERGDAEIDNSQFPKLAKAQPEEKKHNAFTTVVNTSPRRVHQPKYKQFPHVNKHTEVAKVAKPNFDASKIDKTKIKTKTCSKYHAGVCDRPVCAFLHGYFDDGTTGWSVDSDGYCSANKYSPWSHKRCVNGNGDGHGEWEHFHNNGHSWTQETFTSYQNDVLTNGTSVA